MKRCIDNRGFTLVELLAVMVILISISLVAVVGITRSLEKGDEKICQEQVELSVNAAKIYFSLEGGSSITVDELINKGYIKNEQMVDKLNKSGTITIDSVGYVSNDLCVK